MSLASEELHLPRAERGIISTTNLLLLQMSFTLCYYPKIIVFCLQRWLQSSCLSAPLRPFNPTGQCKAGLALILKDKPSWADFVLCTFCTCTTQLFVIVDLHPTSASLKGSILCPCHSKPMGRM